jgi:hypothetical protein
VCVCGVLCCVVHVWLVCSVCGVVLVVCMSVMCSVWCVFVSCECEVCVWCVYGVVFVCVVW